MRCVCACVLDSQLFYLFGVAIFAHTHHRHGHRVPRATRFEVLNGAHLPAVRSQPWGLYRDHIAIYKPYTSHI